MDTLRLTQQDDDSYELYVIYDRSVFTTILIDFESNLITFEYLEKILIMASKETYMFNTLKCEVEYTLLDKELTILLKLTLENPPLKTITESIEFKLHMKKESIDDKFDIITRNFDYKINRMLIRPNSRNMWLKPLGVGLCLDETILWQFLSSQYNGSSYTQEIHRRSTAHYYKYDVFSNKPDRAKECVFHESIINYLFPEDILSKKNIMTSDSYCEHLSKYFVSKTKATELFFKKTLQYIFDKYFVNFIRFIKVEKMDTQQKKNHDQIHDLDGIDYKILINVQLDKKPIKRTILFLDNIENLVFDSMKTYSVLDISTYGHCIIEEL